LYIVCVLDDTPPAPPKPKTKIFVDDTKRDHEIKSPNVIRINHIDTRKLSLDDSKVRRPELNSKDTQFRAELAPFLEGNPDVIKLNDINLADNQIETYLKALRKQRQIFEISRDIRPNVCNVGRKQRISLIHGLG